MTVDPARRRLWRLFGWTLAFLALTAATPRGGWAQEAQYSFVLRGVPLDEALRELITRTRLDLGYDPTLVAGKRAYCVAERQPVENVLRCILDGTGLDFYRLSSGLYVLTETPEAPPLRGTLQGIVVDRDTGEPLPYAHIVLADGSAGAVSSETGRFVFAGLPSGAYRLTTSYLGYRRQVDSVWVAPEATAQAQVALDPEPLVVAPIVVDGLQWRLLSDSLGAASMSSRRLLETPGGGLPDVARSLGTLVGVRLSDATADLHVQGGEAGEHQFRLDGAPVFIPVSIGGLVGPFSPFALGRVTVYKTGFGAEVGSQSAGVIQAEHALSRAAPQSFDVQVDPLSANARLGLALGTPGRTSTTVMAAGRYGLWDVYTPTAVRHLLEDWNRTDPFMLAAFSSDAISPSEDAPTPFRRTFSTGNPDVGFYDAHAAARIRFGALRSLYASSYWGRRELDSERSLFENVVLAQRAVDEAPRTRDLYTWDNHTAQLRYEMVLGARALAAIRGRGSSYRLRHDFAVEELSTDGGTAVRLDPRVDNGNRIREYAAEARLDYAVQDRWHLEAAVEPIYTQSRFLIQGTQQLPISHRSSGWRVASFVANRFTLSRRVTADVGARLTYLADPQEVYFEPRLALRYDQPGVRPWSIRVATGLYRQFVNQFDVSSRSARGLLATSRAWLAVDSTVTPPQAAHLAAEALARPLPGWTIRLESYYKRLLHLLAIDYTTRYSARDLAALEGADLAAAQAGDPSGLPSLPQRVFLADGEGYAYGAALVVEKRWGRARVETRYEYSQARRSFRPFYDGDDVPTPWNEPHRLELALDWTPLRDLTLLGRWRGIWGRTWGFRQSYYDFLGAYRSVAAFIPESIEVNIRDHISAYHLTRPQDHRLPPVYQLDLSAAYTLRLGGAMLQTRLDLLNVLDRDNVADWRFAYDPATYARTGLLQREERLLLPFTPSVAVRLAW